MNDSIIKCFRDIGTSFKFVRVLHLARCELKEVQGIQAFEQLEELYISYNDIDELFDIGFLEHLTVLDLEGNNIKSLDQLYYLKRCPSLTDVNLKYNPVANEVAYYQKIQEMVPRIMSLDDEDIDTGTAFFEKKTEESKKNGIMRNINPPKQDEVSGALTQRFANRGIKEEQIHKVCEEELEALVKEPKEADLLVSSIKNYTKEKKA